MKWKKNLKFPLPFCHHDFCDNLSWTSHSRNHLQSHSQILCPAHFQNESQFLYLTWSEYKNDNTNQTAIKVKQIGNYLDKTSQKRILNQCSMRKQDKLNT